MANALVNVLSRVVNPFIRAYYSEKKELPATLSPIDGSRGGWYSLIREPFAGAWQRNLGVDRDTALSYYAVFACTTLIASDISKLRVKLVELTDDVWLETTNPAYSPVLTKPNHCQNRIQFWESWILSKLIHGNTYVLKERDGRKVVTDLYVLHPNRVRALVADSGDIFYRLDQDNIAGIGDVTVPSTEIIHDRWNCLFHPLVGISPLYANNLAATHGLRIQQNSVSFFANASNPGGIITAPEHIDDEEAEEYKQRWEENFGGVNAGRVAVLGGGLTFQRMGTTPVDAQLLEQGKWTAEVVCATFHVPPYKVGIGALPNYNNIQALNVEYYSQCLQSLIEAAELCLDEGLSLGSTLGVEFDIENLLRMDSLNLADFVAKLAGGGIFEIDEGRKRFGLRPTKGGNAAYLQQQNYSLEALAKRDASDDPFGVRPTPTAPSAGPGQSPAPATPPPATPAPTPGGKSLLSNAVAARHLNRLMADVSHT